MLLLVCVCAICLVISAAFDMDAIDFDLLVENLTIYNESGTPFSRNRNFLDFLELSTSDNLEMWMTLGGVVLFTAIFSALIIFGTIFSNESILRR